MGLVAITAPSGTGATQMITPSPGAKIFIRGWSGQEDSGSATAKVQLLDAQGGNLIVPLTLAANESIREFVPVRNETGEGIYVSTGGVWLNRLAGTSTVTVYYSLEAP